MTRPGRDGASSNRLRILVLAPVLPTSGAADAGTRYMQLLREHLERQADLFYLVPDSEVIRAVDPAVAPSHRILGGRKGRLTVFLHWLHHRAARVDPSTPYLPYVAALLARDQRRLLREADVIDLQWEELIRLAWLVRKLAPRARIIGTFHDVLSQRYGRVLEAADLRKRRLRWRVARRLARWHEATAMRRLDVALVFAQKDIELLPEGGPAEVIKPPMACDTGRHPNLTQVQPVVLFVGFLARPENQDAVRWMVEAIWPAVRAEVPGASLRVIGKGFPTDLQNLLLKEDGVEFAGFVQDLAVEYAAARVCVAPLRLGAGVKFKVIEAMAAGVPIVSTSVGAEGIGEAEHFAAVADDASSFTRALVRALTSPDDVRAEATRVWALGEYGLERFHCHVNALYLGVGDDA